MRQEEIWKKHSATISVSNIIHAYHKPCDFQKEFAEIINSICIKNNYKKVIEAGCETGITSMLLDNCLEKHFLDLNDDILVKVKDACKQLNIDGFFNVENMFFMSYPDNSFDVVFNSGVIEHFNKEDRIIILKEYKRILKPDGAIIVAIPNHYSFPYRSAYLVKKKLLNGYQWPWPDEYKIYDMKKEIEGSNLKLISRSTLAKNTIFAHWGFIRPIKKLMQLSDIVLSYEGYLTVLLIKNK
ncbi:MAG: class I SAM-dependent methyltransferase [Methylomonas sp.]|nr:class I SAM-dependent methyltransferase [Methylomonas sp.]PPD20525.1 MAG: hypothetical protein CTY23_08655 [Methylomonas sp.]PPD40793.1 MAG: hypothetical protein CTY17_05305 [Methylomonas sp.]PPD52949.1 MAG: hypothetical protein CTY11_07820 [Methylomonas sp.]